MAVSGGYFPVYPHHDSLPDPEIRTFITNFYRASDRPDANELWVSYFTKDADVHIGKNRAEGEQSIRELRARMWEGVGSRRHTVAKVFPGRFQVPGEAEAEAAPPECEYMLFGEVELTGEDGAAARVSGWAGRATVRLERDGERQEWKMAQYRVWIQS